MTTSPVAPELHNLAPIKRQIDSEIDSLVAALPDPKDLTPEQRRGIIARYSAVLEGNFIYWMHCEHTCGLSGSVALHEGS